VRAPQESARAHLSRPPAEHRRGRGDALTILAGGALISAGVLVIAHPPTRRMLGSLLLKLLEHEGSSRAT
jgi:hypothetical protein